MEKLQNFEAARKRREKPEKYSELIQMLYEQSMSGNIKAMELLLDLTGESLKQMELKIKKSELKLKEKAIQKNEPVQSAEEPMLYKALGADEE